MPRLYCCRRIAGRPAASIFKPIGIPVLKLEEVTMSLDEFETVRLADLDGLYQEQAAEHAVVVGGTRALSFDALSDGSVVLTVGEGCIQTAAKRAHCELTAVLLEGRAATATLGVLADMLERFLTKTDFTALRADHPELAGGRPCRVRLERREDDSVGWSLVEPK